ncbi:MAG TPA: hypothetical protein VK014_08655 [Cyclobacteriaceae bacterium]|nr:hypothetical protein [Cyclobacteriaceae bacterium]
MKKYCNAIILSALMLLVNLGWSHAHALYIDTDTQGKLGKEQEVKIYYSEFADGTVEKVADWYSDVKEFQLWLIHPDGKKTALETEAQEDHFTASFIPERKGTYRLEVSHTAEDPGEKTAYQFNTFAQVQVGKKASELPLTAGGPDLYLLETSQKGKDAKTFVAYFKGQVQEGVKATLFLPSGETKEVTSDAAGQIHVQLPTEGTYFIEATTFHEKEGGQTKKASYESIWRCATQKIEIG